MIPVFQNRFYDPKTRKAGNSFNACLASLLELPLREMPVFDALPHQQAYQLLVDKIYEMGMVLECFGPKPGKGYVIASGMTHDHLPHSVIKLHGQVIHDPHPLKLPLSRVEEFWGIRAIDEAYHNGA